MSTSGMDQIEDAQQQGSQPAGNARSGLIAVNNLNYSLKPDLSVCTTRTSTSQFFQQDTYAPGSTMVCIFNTGSSYIYGPNTSLVFTVNNTNAYSIHFGGYGGSAANLISRVTIYTRSGLVLERVDASHVLSAIKGTWGHTADWKETTGDAYGLCPGPGGVNSMKIPPASSQRFVIPMSILSGLFECPELIPSALASGLRIELALNEGLTCMVPGEPVLALAPRPTYQIVKPKIETESYMLTDSISRYLNGMAATTGLEFVFNTHFNTINSRNFATASLNVESRRACSRALGAVYKETRTNSYPWANVDYVSGNVRAVVAPTITDGYGPLTAQYRVGSLYFPNTMIGEATTFIAAGELYYMSLKGMNCYNESTSNTNTGPRFQDFIGSAPNNQVTSGSSNVTAVSLERSNTLDLTGIPISNSRVLALNGTYANIDAINAELQGNLFLYFTSLARVFLSNCTLEV